MVDLTRIIIIAGYATVAAVAWLSVKRFHYKARAVAAGAIGIVATIWAIFYSIVMTVDVSANLTAVTLGSRLAHIPTIAAAAVILVLLRDINNRERELLQAVLDE